MHKFRIVLIGLFCVMGLYGCNGGSNSKEAANNDAKVENVSIEQLATETNLKVMDKNDSLYGGIDSWRIEQVDKTEVMVTTTLKGMGPVAELIYNIWYGQDDLSAGWEATIEGVNQGVSRIDKDLKISEELGDVKAKIDMAKEMEKIMEGEGATIDYFSGNEDLSHRTIKVMSYGFVKKEYDKVPYGYWKQFVNRSDDGRVFFNREGDGWILTGGEMSKKTLMARTKSYFLFFNGQTLKEFPNIETPKMGAKTGVNGYLSGRGVADNVRNLTYDVYMILAGKEAKYFPEYANALVTSFEEDERDYFGKVIGAMAGAEKSRNFAFLWKLKWGMSVQEVQELVPNPRVEEANGTKYITVDNNVFSASTCVEDSTIFFSFERGGLSSIDHTMDLSEECNTISSDEDPQVAMEYRKLYEEVRDIYDPTNKQETDARGFEQKWENAFSSFSLQIDTPYDVKPPSPSGVLSVGRVKGGEPVVVLEKREEGRKKEDGPKVSSSSLRWEGEWSWSDDHNGGSLQISKQEKDSVHFVLNTHSGARVRSIEGVSKFVSNDKAEYTGEEYRCEITFIHKGDHVDVKANEKCVHHTMDGTSFSGIYSRGASEETGNLASYGIVPQNVDNNLRGIAGEDYSNFVTYFDTVFDGRDNDGLGATVKTGFVKGAPTLDAMIMYTNSGNVWAAYHGEGQSINYYTNVEASKSEVPITIYKYFKDKYQKIGIRYMSE
ncbi:hypothetical protein LCL98_24860 [Rossellomorea aquimaris]|nr:hypothetical protein [Rossellomorea aquimaris]